MAKYKGADKRLVRQHNLKNYSVLLAIYIIIFTLISSCAPLGNYLYLTTQLQSIQERLDSIEENIASNKDIQPKQSARVDFEGVELELKGRIAKLETKTSQIEKLQSSMQGTLQSLKAELENVSKQFSSQVLYNYNYNTLQSKITSLENQLKQIGSLQKEIDSISAQIRDIKKQTLDTKISQISQSDIDFLKQLQQQISDIKSAIQRVDIISLLKLDSGYILYSIRPGDTLSSISNAYKVNLNKLTEINGIKDPTKLTVGQLIKIPVDDPKSYVRAPLKIDPKDIVAYHGQEQGGYRKIGMDIMAKGKDIYPILPGRVINVNNNTITIDHGNMIMTISGGIETSLKVGSFVSNDKPLGKCIDIFHFELYIDGEPRDPIRLFTEYKGIFIVTFYSEWDDGKVPTHPTFRIAQSGKIPKQFLSIAVDPAIIPIGSLVYIPTLSNTIFIAEDTGSAIKGNRIDVYVSDVRLALNKGISPHAVYLIRPDLNN